MAPAKHKAAMGSVETCRRLLNRFRTHMGQTTNSAPIWTPSRTRGDIIVASGILKMAPTAGKVKSQKKMKNDATTPIPFSSIKTSTIRPPVLVLKQWSTISPYIVAPLTRAVLTIRQYTLTMQVRHARAKRRRPSTSPVWLIA
eukprot:GHVU01015432.1.p3 GENE.GHVU01015432.1~~GHVU01015432.1.p3  ORF type:complete len:143 (-),score=10.14 GHVU01015432.1:393-821(-)